MTLEEAKQRFEPVLDDATELPPHEVNTFAGIIAANLNRWGGTIANPQGLTINDFSILYVAIPPQYWMPMKQRHAVIQSKKNGKAYMSDLSLAVLGGGYVQCGEMANLSR